MLVEQREGGSLQHRDARLLEGVFEFSEKTAQEVMTPAHPYGALDADLTVEAAADQVAVQWPFALSTIPSRSTTSSVWCTPRPFGRTPLQARSTIRVIMRPPLSCQGPGKWKTYWPT